MTVVHIVLMAFEPLATPDEIDKVVQNMLGLKDKCVHPESQKPYIKSRMGGVNVTSEGFANGYSHSFVIEFETAEHCTYYSDEDPAHLAFIESTSGIVAKTLVVDFTPGTF